MGPLKEESPSWVSERDDNHGEETKNKATSNAGKRERASGTTWYLPLVWTKERPGRKSARKAAHWSYWPLRFGSLKKNSSALWSVWTQKLLPTRYPCKKWRLSTIANISWSIVLYTYYVVVNFLEKYSTGWKEELEICYYNTTAPMASPDASICTSHLVPGVGSNNCRTGALQSCFFNRLNAFSYSEPQLN